MAAYRKLLNEADAQLFDGLWRVEDARKASPFADRVMVKRRKEKSRR